MISFFRGRFNFLPKLLICFILFSCTEGQSGLKNTFTVTTVAGAHGTITPTQTVKANSKVIITIKPDTGYEIETLLVDGEEVENSATYTFNAIHSDHTVAVTFKLKQSEAFYSITTSAGANGTITATLEVLEGNNGLILITPNNGYQIDTLSVDGLEVEVTDSYLFSNVTANHTILATFKPITYTIFTSADSNGAISGSTTVNFGDDFIATIVPNTGYEINQIKVDNQIVTNASSYTFTNVSSDHSIVVTFKLKTYNVITNAGLNGNITQSSAVNHGANFTVSITPASGYEIDTLQVNDINVTPTLIYVFENITANQSISATFKIIPPAANFTITTMAGSNGSITASTTVGINGSVTITITPNTGYEMESLTVDGVAVAITNSYVFSNITSNHTIVAAFKVIVYTITTITGSNGSITANSSVAHGGTAVILITPSAGYEINTLLVDGVSIPATNSYTFTNVTASHTVSVTFKLTPILGTVIAFGYNDYGQTNVPSDLSNVNAIAGGGNHAVALKTNGTVVAWGYNAFGQCNVPNGLVGVTAIAAGAQHTLALKSDGTVVAWGQDHYSQNTVPGGLSDVTAIVAGAYHNVALKSDGTVVAWGRNNYGQTTVPAGLSNVIKIVVGAYHTIALKSDGSLVGWGLNDKGQLTFPGGLADIANIAIGGLSSHTIILKTDKTINAWGRNDEGQTDTPIGLTEVSSVAVGGFHTVVLKSDGTVLAWGKNDIGQCDVPVDLTGANAVAAGRSFTMVLK